MMMSQIAKGKHLSPAHEQPDSFSVVVVEEGTFSCIERCNGSHVFGTQLKIEDIDILLHSFNVSSFGYDNYAALDKPSQSYLCDGFTILASDFCQERIREEPVTTFGEGAPRHDMRAKFFHNFLRFNLLVEYVCFYLIHSRYNFYITCQINEMVRIEIWGTERNVY